jgi:hypothetical protein
MRQKPGFGLALNALLLFAAGCRSSVVEPNTPEQAYVAFAKAVRMGELETAWASLSTPTRTLLAARSKDISEKSMGLIQDEPSRIFFQSGLKPQKEIGPVKIVTESDTQATLEIQGMDGREKITLLKEGTRWTVDLTSALK